MRFRVDRNFENRTRTGKCYFENAAQGNQRVGLQLGLVVMRKMPTILGSGFQLWMIHAYCFDI